MAVLSLEMVFEGTLSGGVVRSNEPLRANDHSCRGTREALSLPI